MVFANACCKKTNEQNIVLFLNLVESDEVTQKDTQTRFVNICHFVMK